MDYSDIKSGLNDFVERYDSQTFLGSYRETFRDSLLKEGLSTRANSLWKMAEYVVARYDNSDVPIESYITGWRQLASNYNNQFLLLEEEQNNWGIYDAQGNRFGGEEEIIKLFDKKRIESASAKRPPKKTELIRQKTAAAFLREAIKITLTHDSDLSKLLTKETINVTHKNKTLSINGFRLGVNKEFLPSRASDYSSDIFWHYNGNTYFLNMEITQDGMEKFLFPTYNNAYRSCFEMCKEGNEYVLYQFISSQHIYSGFPVQNKHLSYLTALRTKPFILLAGISGTGKSRIVRKLAQATTTQLYTNEEDRWRDNRPNNFELIQVKPNWHNSMDVVGFYSNISKKYEFTPFVEFIVKAWQDKNTPYFLCLDEMNLAPVEEYFAEFLSAIESRAIDENGEYVTDPIIKPFNKFGKDVCEDMLKQLLGEAHHTEANPLANQFSEKGLTLPPNLMVMGTVNMDETTFSFSRKVLDRAMSVEMNEVDYDKFLSGESEQFPLLTDINELLVKRPQQASEVKDGINGEIVVNYLKLINAVLDGTPFKLGYRAANEAMLYVSASQDFEGNQFNIATALDEFTLMKILSRIEGDKRSIGDKLDELQTVITESYPKSNKKLREMAVTLKNKQFVSYWT